MSDQLTIRHWFCEWQDKIVRWIEPFWPLFCPVCGKACHEQLSSHHWFKEDEEHG